MGQFEIKGVFFQFYLFLLWLSWNLTRPCMPAGATLLACSNIPLFAGVGLQHTSHPMPGSLNLRDHHLLEGMHLGSLMQLWTPSTSTSTNLHFRSNYRTLQRIGFNNAICSTHVLDYAQQYLATRPHTPTMTSSMTYCLGQYIDINSSFMLHSLFLGLVPLQTTYYITTCWLWSLLRSEHKHVSCSMLLSPIAFPKTDKRQAPSKQHCSFLMTNMIATFLALVSASQGIYHVLGRLLMTLWLALLAALCVF